MENIPVVLAIAGIFCAKTSAYFVTIDDFSPSELADLSLQQEHELMLQKLATKEVSVLASAFYYEMLSMSVGNYFFAFAPDESTARKNNAIVRATFGCLKQLLIQDRADQLLLNVSINGAEYVKTFGNISFAFSLTCSDLDSSLANETQYITLRDKFERRRYALPNEVYHYTVANSTEDEIRVLRDLVCEPAMKVFMAHHTWVHIADSEESKLKNIKNAAFELAEIPEKLPEVQKLYDLTIDEIIPRMMLPNFKIDEPWTGHIYYSHLQPNLTKNLWSRITENIPDWTDYFECNPSDDEETDDSSANSKQGRNQRCGKVQVKPDPGLTSDNVWPVTTDFDPVVLLNLTSEQKHELFLQELAKKHTKLIEKLLYLELLAKSTGYDFFGFVKDEQKNAQNNAICRAVIECFSNLRFQALIRDVIENSTRTESEYVRQTGDIGEGFNRVCSHIDKNLTDVDAYTLKRDKYVEENVTSPTKTYQYSIADPSDNQRKIVAELFNDPQMIKYFLHFFWSSTNIPESTPEETRVKVLVSRLAQVRSQAKTIQRIYDQSVDEVAPYVKGYFSTNAIFQFVDTPEVEPLSIEVKDLFTIRSRITEQIRLHVNEYPILFAIFKEEV